MDYPDTYASHTPGTDDIEELEYFSTSAVASREEAVHIMKDMLPALSDHRGVVLELERIIAIVDNGKWTETTIDSVPAIREDEVGYRKSPTLPIEIHHAFDVLAKDKPLRLEELLQKTGQMGIRVGGWFNFAKEGEWSYRSNAFVHKAHLKDYVMREHGALSEFVKMHKIPVTRTWTLVEQVLGIWRIPVLRWAQERE
jgi:hypothetical protein